MAAKGLFLVIPWEVVESIDRATIRLAERITNLSAPKPRPLGPFGHPAPAGLTPLNFPAILTRQGHKPHLFGNLSLQMEPGFYLPMVSADFPLTRTRLAPILVSATMLPRGGRLDPLCYDNARMRSVCRGPKLACHQYTMEPFGLGLKSAPRVCCDAEKNRSPKRR